MSETNAVSPLRQRMIEDMAARKLNPHTQRGHISSCKRFAAWLKRSPDTATPDEVRGFQLYLTAMKGWDNSQRGSILDRTDRSPGSIFWLYGRQMQVNHDFKNEVFPSYEPHPAPPCNVCGAKPALLLKMLNPQSGKTVRMFKCGCGEQTWSEDK